MTLILSIETALGQSYREKFHMGTMLSVAKDEAEKRFHGRLNFGLPCASVAVKDIEADKVICVYDGEWN